MIERRTFLRGIAATTRCKGPAQLAQIVTEHATNVIAEVRRGSSSRVAATAVHRGAHDYRIWAVTLGPIALAKWARSLAVNSE